MFPLEILAAYLVAVLVVVIVVGLSILALERRK
jgi:hypothetical protein